MRDLRTALTRAYTLGTFLLADTLAGQPCSADPRILTLPATLGPALPTGMPGQPGPAA
jgi:hypothetical protein